MFGNSHSTRRSSPIRQKDPSPPLWQGPSRTKTRLKEKKYLLQVFGIKAKHVEGKSPYVKLCEEARAKISSVYFEPSKKWAFWTKLMPSGSKRVREVQDVKESIAKFGWQDLQDWKFSLFEERLLHLCLNQLESFIEFLIWHEHKLFLRCHSLQELLTAYVALYCNKHENSTTCDISFLLYVCNFETDLSQIKVHEKTLTATEDFKFLKEPFWDYSDSIKLIVSTNLDASKIKSKFPVISADKIDFESFNSSQRRRMMYGQLTFSILNYSNKNSSKINASVTADSATNLKTATINNATPNSGSIKFPPNSSSTNCEKHKSPDNFLLLYTICPRFANDSDVSVFLENPLTWLTVPPLLDCSLISTEKLTSHMVTPDFDLFQVREYVFGNKQAELYEFLETTQLNQSYLNSKVWTLRPSLPSAHSEFLSLTKKYKDKSILLITDLALKDRPLFDILMTCQPNFGTDLWISLDSGKRNILVHFGFFSQWMLLLLGDEAQLHNSNKTDSSNSAKDALLEKASTREKQQQQTLKDKGSKSNLSSLHGETETKKMPIAEVSKSTNSTPTKTTASYLHSAAANKINEEHINNYLEKYRQDKMAILQAGHNKEEEKALNKLKSTYFFHSIYFDPKFKLFFCDVPLSITVSACEFIKSYQIHEF